MERQRNPGSAPPFAEISGSRNAAYRDQATAALGRRRDRIVESPSNTYRRARMFGPKCNVPLTEAHRNVLVGPVIERDAGNMTLRIDWACAAMAALALIMTGAATAHAAVQISDGWVSDEPPGYRTPDSTATPRTRITQSTYCDINPLRCRYNPNGRKYYWTRDRRMPGSAGTPNRAAWGCGATDGKVRGRSWNFSNRTAASYRALSECSRKTTSARCHIVSCRPSVHSSYEAIAIWGPNTQQ